MLRVIPHGRLALIFPVDTLSKDRNWVPITYRDRLREANEIIPKVLYPTSKVRSKEVPFRLQNTIHGTLKGCILKKLSVHSEKDGKAIKKMTVLDDSIRIYDTRISKDDYILRMEAIKTSASCIGYGTVVGYTDKRKVLYFTIRRRNKFRSDEEYVQDFLNNIKEITIAYKMMEG